MASWKFVLAAFAHFLGLAVLARPDVGGAHALDYRVIAEAAQTACIPQTFDDPPMRVGDVICLKREDMDSTLRAQFFALDPKASDIIVVAGLSGSLDVAMDIGDFIYEHDNLVVVAGACFSACANHIALGARRVVMLEGGAVSFHRGPAVDDAVLRAKYAGSPWLTEALRINERALRFFRRRGVDPEISTIPPAVYWDKPAEYWWNHGWVYSVEEMKRFGVANVVYCAGGLSCEPAMNRRAPNPLPRKPPPNVLGPPADWKPPEEPAPKGKPVFPPWPMHHP